MQRVPQVLIQIGLSVSLLVVFPFGATSKEVMFIFTSPTTVIGEESAEVIPRKDDYPRNTKQVSQQQKNLVRLIKALEREDTDTVRQLVLQGTDVNLTAKDGWTPLMAAVVKGNMSTIRFLVEQGADINAQEADGWTPLMLAIEQGHGDIAKFLISIGAEVNAKTADAMTSLMLAIEYNNLELIELLLAQGADINAQENLLGMTPLMWAAEKGFVKIATRLIEHGVNVDMEDKDQWTALMMAISEKHLDVVQLLFEAGADIHTRRSNWSPLMWAVMHGNIQIVKFLLNQGSDLYETDQEGKTALRVASDMGHTELASFLAQAGATP